MKVIRALVFALILLVLSFLLLAAFSPGSYEVTRSLMIEEEVTAVFDYAADLRHYDEWNPWIAKETDARSSVRGSGSTVGSRFSWEGDTIGSGYMVIREILEPSMVASDIFFTSPWEASSDNIMHFSPKDDSTEVTWTMTGSYAYPFERFIMLFSNMDKNIGPDFENGLNRLRERIVAGSLTPESN